MIIMLVDKQHITEYIPQRPPFVMIDELVTASETGFGTRFEISAENLFLEDGVLSESSLIENIAQTCAAGFGYVNAQKGESAGQLGFIGAVSRLTVTGVARLGDQIETQVTVLNSFDNIHLVEGTASANGTPLVNCQLKIVIA